MSQIHRTTAWRAAACGGLALILVLAGGVNARAALLLYEGFDYGDTDIGGTAITGLNGGSGWTGSWTRNGSHFRYVAAGGLTYSNGGTLVVTGGALSDTTFGGGGGNQNMTREMFAVDTDKTYWFSFLAASTPDPDNTDNQVQNWTMFFSNSGSASAGFGAEMGRGADNEIAAEFGGGTDPTGATYTRDGTGQLVVGRARLSSVGNDLLDLWVNIPLSATEGTIGLAHSSTSLATPTFGNFFTYLMQPGGNDFTTFDEIRLGESLADVIPVVGGGAVVPEPQTIVLWGIIGIGLVGCVCLQRRRRRS